MKKITGIILVGGKSSRMGTDKGLLELNGKKFINHILDAVIPVVDEIIIVANNSSYDELGYKVVHDIIKDCGPLGGLYSGLLSSQTEKNLLVSCDMPDITSATLRSIILQSGNEDATVPFHHDISEPLCAVFEKKCIEIIKDQIDKKEFKMKTLLTKINVKYVRFISGEVFSPNDFFNINTPIEFELRKQLDK